MVRGELRMNAAAAVVAAAKHKLRSSDGTVIPFGSGGVGLRWAVGAGRTRNAHTHNDRVLSPIGTGSMLSVGEARVSDRSFFYAFYCEKRSGLALVWVGSRSKRMNGGGNERRRR